MDVSRLLMVLVVVMSTLGGKSEASISSCIHLDQDRYKLMKGEAFYYVPRFMEDVNLPDENITWYKNGPDYKNITTDEGQRIHYHGGALLLLNISDEDSGNYTARHITPSDECFYYPVRFEVFSENSRENLTYGSIKNSYQNKLIPCPSPVEHTCITFNGNFTWLKGNNLLPGKHEAHLRVENAQKADEDIYTCICTWTHNNKVYNSSGSRRLIVLGECFQIVEIVSPTSKEQLVDEGDSIKLNCTVYCGINAKRECRASWRVDGSSVNQIEGYNETTTLEIKELSKYTYSTAILTIERVSAKDFHYEFKCHVSGYYETSSSTLILKQRESITPVIIAGVCVVLIAMFAAMLVKYFAIDLALLLRPYLPPGRHNKDTRVYDAYVVYQTQSLDKETEEKLNKFVTKTLPSVLEEKCGYRLFIQGRDDIPGEDRVELVERCIKQSRRLMVILTPGTESEIMGNPTSDQTSVTGGLDYQVGLHYALMQREMSVILIQLGETGPQGYTHLPPGLQHLIRKSAPIRWPEGSQKVSKWNSRFWKRVRYLMPTIPAQKCDSSSII
ncbi:interleukin-1 receptor-like 1 isoform 2-T2 [Fundulus diaphanus]